jgi:hypothetical protein
MRISAKKTEVFIPKSANSITSYNFTECLTLLNKLQRLDSLVLQSPYYQYIIKVLEDRIKRLAQNKTLLHPAIFPGQQQTRITL